MVSILSSDSFLETFPVEPQYNESPYNEDLGISRVFFFQPSYSKMYGKEPQFNEPPW